MDRPKGTTEIQLLRDSSRPIADAAVDWAVSALADGYDTESLRLLAGMDLGGQPVSSEVIPVLAMALQELGIPDGDFGVTARQYVREIAEAALSGDIAPRRAAELVHRRVITPLEHPADLMPWCYVWEGNSFDCSRMLEDDEIDDEILRVAAAFGAG